MSPAEIITTLKKPYATRLAKFALWSPFIGLLPFFALIGVVGLLGGFQPSPIIVASLVGLCCSIWMTGLALGVTALRRTKTEGRKEILGRAIVGMAINLLFLALAGWSITLAVRLEMQRTRLVNEAAEREADSVRARVGD